MNAKLRESSSSSSDGVWDRLSPAVAKSEDPVIFGSVVVAFIGFAIYEPMSALSTLTGVVLMGGFFYLYNNHGKTKKNTASNNSKSKATSNTTTNSTSTATRLKNIWDAGTSRGSGSNKKAYHDDKKPFGSKYYYAHNNPNATGGYKDGLRTEDFAMNGPRLLSKDGKSVNDDDDNDKVPSSSSAQSSSEQPVVVQEVVTKSKIRITAHDPNVMFITKYLWDDPGDINGIATIRIDTLPEKKNGKTTTIDWKDVNVETVKVKADLVGEGLLVKVDTADGGKYQLKISKLYGDAAEVKIVIKPKRLMVRIYKKKKAVLAFRGGDASNLEAWPQPYRKV